LIKANFHFTSFDFGDGVGVPKKEQVNLYFALVKQEIELAESEKNLDVEYIEMLKLVHSDLNFYIEMQELKP